jgi:hypothetical protein
MFRVTPWLFVCFSAVSSASLLVGCGGDSLTSADGEPCANIGDNACFDNTTHLCRYINGEQVWEPREACGESTTPNCQCALVSGQVMECLVDGNTSSPVRCSGTRLND